MIEGVARLFALTQNWKKNVTIVKQNLMILQQALVISLFSWKHGQTNCLNYLLVFEIFRNFPSCFWMIVNQRQQHNATMPFHVLLPSFKAGLHVSINLIYYLCCWDYLNLTSLWPKKYPHLFLGTTMRYYVALCNTRTQHMKNPPHRKINLCSKAMF